MEENEEKKNNKKIEEQTHESEEEKDEPLTEEEIEEEEVVKDLKEEEEKETIKEVVKEAVKEVEEEEEDVGKSHKMFWTIFRTVVYVVIVALGLFIVTYIFQWETVSQVPPLLKPIAGAIIIVNKYLLWIQAGIIIVIGYLIINRVSKSVSKYVRRTSGRTTASSIRTIIRIIGFGVLLAVIASILSFDPTAAIAFSSFIGLVFGFAGQNVIGNVIAGMVLVLTRPLRPGEEVTIAGRTGTVREITLMRVRILLPNGEDEVLIPSSKILTSTILRKKRDFF